MSTTLTAPAPETTAASEHRWEARPVLALAVRLATVVVPSLAAAAATVAVARNFERPTGPVPAATWWLAMLALGAVAYAALERISRRLVPLSTLLRLSLVFPDRTPSRYRLALRAGTTRHLRAAVDSVEAGRLGDTPAEAAETALVLLGALNRHDRLTRGHSERVRAYAELLGEQMGLAPRDRELLRWSALLHDIGKLRIPSEILNKPGRLTDAEFAVITTHPAEGEQLVAPLLDWLGQAANAVGQHHERFDGTGYPRRLAGEEICFSGRIVSVADTYDVITSARSYKRPMSPAAARREIARCAGTQFDPEVARALLDLSIGRLWWIGGPMTWIASVPLLSKLPTAAATAPSFGAAVPAIGNVAAAGVVAASVLGVASVAPSGGPATGQEVAAIAIDGATPGDHTTGGAAGSGDPAGQAGAGSGDSARAGGGGAGASDGDAVDDETADPDAPGTADAPADGTRTDDGSGGTRTDVERDTTPTVERTAPSGSSSPTGSSLDDTVDGVTGVVGGTVGGVTGVVNGTVGGVTGTVDSTVGGVTGALPGGVGDTVGGTVDGVTDLVDDTVGGVTGTVDGVVGGLTDTLGGLFGRRR